MSLSPSAAMAATTCAERPPWRGRSVRGRSAPGRLWRYCLGVSLLLHGALLWLPVGGPPAPSASRPQPALTLTLKSSRAALPVATPSPATPVASSAGRGGARHFDATPRAATSRALSASRVPPAASEAPATPAAPPPTSAELPSHLDVDELRAQARDLARASPETLVRGGERRPLPADPLDGARLEALARRIGKPLQVASERSLADGSRIVRFVGNVCLRVPRNLPMGFENAFGPTVLVPTNCSD